MSRVVLTLGGPQRAARVIAGCCCVLILSACGSGEKTSGLAARSQPTQSDAPTNPPAKTSDPPATKALPKTPPTTTPKAGDTNPPPQLPAAASEDDNPIVHVIDEAPTDATRYQLFLALPADTTYKTTTIGMVEFSLVQQPTGFAREELIELANCSGDGGKRVCTLNHRYLNFDAEPPQGNYLKNDEKAVADIQTSYRLDGTGHRLTKPALTGDAEQLASEAGRALAPVDRLYCLRFPEQKVAVGTTWQHTCHMRTGGMIDSRVLTWKLEAVSDDPITKKSRAELSYVGAYQAAASNGLRQGGLTGRVYMWLEAGEPHLLKEKIEVVVDADKGLRTTTTSTVQFAKLVDPTDTEKVIRTDGMPFPNPPKMPTEAPAQPDPQPSKK